MSQKPTIREISLEPEKNIASETIKPQEITIGDRHNFKIGDFDGPLDLLVTLIKEKNIDIFDVDLFELSTQYLNIIKHLQTYEIDLASEYLVMAATLLQLKARMVLQDPTIEEEIKEEKKRLLEQIAEYEKFKQISQVLRQQELIRDNFFTKEPEETGQYEREIDETVLDGHANSSRLVVALRKMFERTYAEMIRSIKISTVAVSPEEQKERIIALFKTKDSLDFREVFNVPTIGHFVITLLAVLDLARQQIVVIEQDGEDANIRFKKGVEYEE
ncbi:segregation and condensation protein A [Metamycoplasma arthritidis]|uniref:Segregation and condensation protein A n=1 Tax=Metamycoplasma arthritidis (strain 158L3-1) TaxID=243272 RepID=B3PLS5_META1|nr:segregation/condensation protein A [Metamycoplasma arthritidis]ACF06977.1 segregation and condensation protein A [Metamycoplasma arthritidis 158L3-1]VEU78506.1 segregation and condensation protein A [Metamycoplasma arthritidis]